MNEYSPARDMLVAAASTSAPHAIHTFARRRLRRASDQSAPPRRNTVPNVLRATAQREAWPPRAPLGGGWPRPVLSRTPASTGATAITAVAASVATTSPPAIA